MSKLSKLIIKPNNLFQIIFLRNEIINHIITKLIQFIKARNTNKLTQ